MMRRVLQQMGGGGPGGFGGGGPPRGDGGNFRGGGGFFAGGASPQMPRPAAANTDYLFGGDYWVVAMRADQPVPVAVKTGLTDLEYSEVVSGLEPGDRVLLLPSTSLYEQERLQEFITQRFGSSTPFQQNNQQQNQARFLFR